MDYTNKYGFGYLMGSGIMGIIFNDNTKITTKVPFDINEDPTQLGYSEKTRGQETLVNFDNPP